MAEGDDSDDLATGISTGALPPRRAPGSVTTEPAKTHDRSRAITPQWLSDDPRFQRATQFFGAGIASMFTAIVTNPVDIIKVRQQLQTQGPGSVWHMTARMLRTEGFTSLMNGTSASILREGTYSTIRLGTYEMFKDLLKKNTGGIFHSEGLPLKVTSSIIAGTLGSAIANPTDLVKIRMQAYYPSGRPYRSMRHAFVSIYHETLPGSVGPVQNTFLNGMQSLYRGVIPTVARGWAVAACQMPAYDHTKQWLKQRDLLREGVYAHLAASSFAGLVVSLASNPVDVVKVRIMNDSTSRYRGIWHCVASTVRYEGPTAFYKGFGMCWARLGTHTIVTYMIYEQLRLLAGVKPL